MSGARPTQAAALLLALLLCGTARADLLAAEADRLTNEATARRAEPGGAAALMRLEALSPWLPAGLVEGRLQAAAADPQRAPLGRAVAAWLLRGLALERLDAETARAAVRPLGMLTAFAMRTGPAPAPTETLAPGGWRPYPTDAGTGEVWLDAFLRPARETQATLAARVTAPGGPAVLRIGFDDAATVWLNGDEVFKAPAEHPAWLDQEAIPVALRPGDNRLVVEVRQRRGAWRFSARFTDAEGRPLAGVEAHPDPWGPCPDPAPPPPAADPPASLWTAFIAAADEEPPHPERLRDLATYAHRTGLPDADQARPRVALMNAWEVDPGPRTLKAWLDLLPEDQRAAVRAAHVPARPVLLADVVADAFLRVDAAWVHYYARRPHAAREILERLLAEAPDFLPATYLLAIVHEDVGLPHTSANLLGNARRAHPRVTMLRRALLGALRAGERRAEQRAELEALVAEGLAGPDDLYQLALMRRDAGDTDAALALLDRVVAARPELWAYALEAAEVRMRAGDHADARARLEALRALASDEAQVLEPLARLAADEGDRAEAAELLRRAVAAEPGRDDLARYLASLTGARTEAAPGPPLEELLAIASPAGSPAHVLYHHARTEVGASGLAARRVRRVVRLLTEEGARRYGEWELPYVPGRQRLEVETARLVRQGEPPASPRRSDRDLSEPQYRLYYDLLAEVLTFPRPRAGDVIEVVWRLTDVAADPAFPGYYGEIAFLQEAAPRAHSVVEVAAARPEALRVRLTANGLAVAQEGLRFEARDVPAAPLEGDGPGASSVRAHLHVSTVADWAEVSRRYAALMDGRDRPDRALTELAKRWAGDARTPEEMIERLYVEVAHRIRYVGLELGLHSFKPEQPSLVLARGYGDCKDKATLLIALARALGLEAHLTLVRTRSQGEIGPAPASFAVFDHAIVYLPTLQRFVDPTVDRNDPWTLPPPDQEAVALVVGVDEAPRRVPAQPAQHNRSAWTLDVRLAPDGTARGTATWETSGHFATVARRNLEAEGTRREYLERLLADGFPGVRAAAPALSGLTPALDPVSARLDVTLPAFPRSGGGFAIPVGVAPWRLVERFAQSAVRNVPLRIDFRRQESRRLRLPAGVAGPAEADRHLDSKFGRARLVVARQDGALTLDSSVNIEVSEVSVADYPAFRAWLADVDRALSSPVEVRP